MPNWNIDSAKARPRYWNSSQETPLCSSNSNGDENYNGSVIFRLVNNSTTKSNSNSNVLKYVKWLHFLVVSAALLSLATLAGTWNTIRFWRARHAAVLLKGLVGNSTSASTTTTTTTTTNQSRFRNPAPPILPPQGEAPHVVYDDLKYRRVCAMVYHSLLCMIVRYPIDVPLQDPNVTYPYPIHPAFYGKNNITLSLEFLDWPQSDHDCVDGDDNHSNNATNEEQAAASAATTSLPHRRYYRCLEQVAAQRNSDSGATTTSVVLVLFTRQLAADQPEQWYGTGSEMQAQRVEDFFSSHTILVLGASPSPYITFAVSRLFQACNYDHAPHNYTCVSAHQQQQQQQQPNIFLRPLLYYPPLDPDLWKLFYDVNASSTLLETLQAQLPPHNHNNNNTHNDNNRNSTEQQPQQQRLLRPLSILVDFPIAHTQTYKMIHYSYEQVQYNQVRFVELIMNITTPEAKLELANTLGYDLQRVIAFDGIPQHFPSDTGAYPDVRQIGSEAEFLSKRGYEGWQPEWGSICQGPLVFNNTLSQVNQLERLAFRDAQTTKTSFDADKWYGNLWEFSNQFWWEAVMWRGPSSLDCTHPITIAGGATTVHRYFLQAMVDRYYEEQGEEEQQPDFH